jgi:hypothetical protein
MNLKRTVVAPLIVGLLLAGTVSTGNASADGRGRHRVDVERVSNDRVIRLLSASLVAPAVDGATTAPATCAHDRRDVWFLPVFTAAGTSTVACEVPRGARLVLNLGGGLCNEDDVTPRDQLVAVCEEFQASGLSIQTATVDGKEIDEFASESTGVFVVDLPAENGLGLPAGELGFAYIGRNVMIDGLGKGAHTIRLIHRLEPNLGDEFDVDITYHVTVG